MNERYVRVLFLKTTLNLDLDREKIMVDEENIFV